MPELPEVETIARGLGAVVTGRTIQAAHILYAGCIRHGDLTAELPRQTILRVSRRAKLLQLELDSGQLLIFHLKMTGRVWATHASQHLAKHTHLILELDGNDVILFEDPRKFGFCGLYDVTALQNWEFYKKLGPEPLQTDARDLAKRMVGRKSGIKSLLLNQTVLAGIGNIYADESLFAARIHPASKAAAIPSAKILQLCELLQGILQEAIAAGGSTISDYRNAYGKSGLFQEKFAVYGKRDEPCPACSRSLQTATVAGRTSTHCPHCQRKY